MALRLFCIAIASAAYHCARRGFRTKIVYIATTLPDDRIWTDEKVAELYGHRWTIETCFRHPKTSMNTHVLKCKTVAGVAREHLMYLLAYPVLVPLRPGREEPRAVRRRMKE